MFQQGKQRCHLRERLSLQYSNDSKDKEHLKDLVQSRRQFHFHNHIQLYKGQQQFLQRNSDLNRIQHM